MADERLPYERLLQESLKGELRLLNSHLPSQLKSLADLLAEDIPSVACSDGSAHLFKRKELDYLAGITGDEDRKKLLLPMLIEVDPGQDKIAVVCRSEVEEKVISRLLDMPVNVKGGRITIYRPQLAVIRKLLKTTTQYLFSARIVE